MAARPSRSRGTSPPTCPSTRCAAGPPERYRYAAAELAVQPASLLLVAAHPWDCSGAHAAGLRAAWVNRTGQHWPAIFPAAEYSAPDLIALVDALLTTGR